MDQVRIAVILFCPLLGQRLNLNLTLVGCVFEILIYALLNDLNAKH